MPLRKQSLDDLCVQEHVIRRNQQRFFCKLCHAFSSRIGGGKLYRYLCQITKQFSAFSMPRLHPCCRGRQLQIAPLKQPQRLSAGCNAALGRLPFFGCQQKKLPDLLQICPDLIVRRQEKAMVCISDQARSAVAEPNRVQAFTQAAQADTNCAF